MVFDITILNKPLKTRTYEILSGEYNNNRVHIKASGTTKQPITINGTGVMITDKTTIKITGSNIILQGFRFKNIKSKKVLKLYGNNIKITNNIFEELMINFDSLIEVSGINNRIDNNVFRTIKCNGPLINVIVKKNERVNCIIDNNSFSDRFHFDTKSSHQEIIRIGDLKSSLYLGNTIVYNNKFNNCENIISIKSCSNIISNNVINGCKGFINLEAGKGNYIIKNYFNGTKKLKTAGIKIIDSDHSIYDNTFENLIEQDPLFNPIIIMNGTSNLKIRDNDFLNCYSCFAIGLKDHNNPIPKQLEITNNRIIKCNYTFSKSKKLKGYKDDSIITNNFLYNYDQKLRLHFGKNKNEINFQDLFECLLKTPIVELPIFSEEYKDDYKETIPKPKFQIDGKLKEILDTFKKLKLLKKEINEITLHLRNLMEKID